MYREELLIKNLLHNGICIIIESQKQFNEVCDLLQNNGFEDFLSEPYAKDLVIKLYTDKTYTTVDYDIDELDIYGFCSAVDFIETNTNTI